MDEFDVYPTPSRSRRSKPTPFEALFVSGICLVLFLILMPCFTKQHCTACTLSCASNLKQEGTGLLQYAQDYDDRFPPAETWMDTAYSYTQNKQILHCLKVSPQEAAKYGYAFNSNLDKFPISKLDTPNQTFILYDSGNLDRNAHDPVTSLASPGRHIDGNNVAYADGHVRWTKVGTPLISQNYGLPKSTQ